MCRVLLLIVMFTGLLSGCQSDSDIEPSPDASRAAPIADATVIDMAHQDAPLADMLVDRGTRVDTGAPIDNQTRCDSHCGRRNHFGCRHDAGFAV